MIENFLNNFIKPQYRERLLYELKSSKTNKRDKAFTKLLDYNAPNFSINKNEKGYSINASSNNWIKIITYLFQKEIRQMRERAYKEFKNKHKVALVTTPIIVLLAIIMASNGVNDKKAYLLLALAILIGIGSYWFIYLFIMCLKKMQKITNEKVSDNFSYLTFLI